MKADERRARAHRAAQLAVRADLLAAFVELWKLLVLGDLRGTLKPWLARVEPLIVAAHDRSAEVAADYYREARAAAIADRLVAERDRFAADGPRRTRTGLSTAAGSGSGLDDRRGGTSVLDLPDDLPGDPFADDLVDVPVRFEPRRPELDPAQVRRSMTATAVGTATRGARQGVLDLDDRAQVAAAKSAGRLALAGGRMTLEDAIERDPAAVGWVRITDGSPCGFCAMLASRGFVYLERETALFVGGTSDPYHDGCGCTTMARFRTDTSPLPASTQAQQDLWYQTGAYFTGWDAINAFRRATNARNRGQDPVEAAFRDVDRSSLKSDEAVRALREQAQRGGTNGLPPDDPRRDVGRP